MSARREHPALPRDAAPRIGLRSERYRDDQRQRDGLTEEDRSSRAIDFDGASDTIRVVNNSVTRATSATLSFSRETLHRIRVDYGAFGTKLSVDGAETTNSTAWTAVATLAPHLGSNSSGANFESAGYGDLLVAA